MERVTFLIERTGDRISCLLNPESLEARRTAGLARRRLATGGVLGNPRSDDPLIPTGGGITEYDLQLLFDVDLANEGRGPRQVAMPPTQSLPALPEVTEPAAEPDAAPVDEVQPEAESAEPEPEPVPAPEPEPDGAVALTEGEESESIETPVEAAPETPAEPAEPAAAPELPPIFSPANDPALVADVRELTQPLWALAETGEPVDGVLVQPRVRFIWGKSWNVPGVVLAVAERLECFDIDGVPRRSWLALRLRRVEDDPEGASAAPPRNPGNPQFLLDSTLDRGSGNSRRSIIVPVGPDGEPQYRPDQISADHYGKPALAMAICKASQCEDPTRFGEGQRLNLPPTEAELLAEIERDQWA